MLHPFPTFCTKANIAKVGAYLQDTTVLLDELSYALSMQTRLLVSPGTC